MAGGRQEQNMRTVLYQIWSIQRTGNKYWNLTHGVKNGSLILFGIILKVFPVSPVPFMMISLSGGTGVYFMTDMAKRGRTAKNE